MKLIFNVFSKQLFGVKYERLTQTGLVCLIVFWGLYIAAFQVPISPCILYLMASAVSAGVMWQALSSEDSAANMKNLLMLPFERRKFVFSYVAAMGSYTFLTKTAVLLAVLLAVSEWSLTEALGSILCAVSAVLTAAVFFSLKKHWFVKALWTAALLAVIFAGWKEPWFLPAIAANVGLAFLLLQKADGYSFCLSEEKSERTVKGFRRGLVWVYFFRYMKSHKNYWANTVMMWCVACVLPLFFRQMEGLSVIPVGFAILSLNTPVCILLSCDPALEQAVRMLPGQKKAFCAPYCLFIFLCSLSADVIFLCSWQIQIGGATLPMMAAAVFFSLQSAVLSVLLEWFFPIRGWKIESDLWHHPRKYMVPVIMLLLAVVVGTRPGSVWALIVALAVEIVGMYWSENDKI